MQSYLVFLDLYLCLFVSYHFFLCHDSRRTYYIKWNKYFCFGNSICQSYYEIMRVIMLNKNDMNHNLWVFCCWNWIICLWKLLSNHVKTSFVYVAVDRQKDDSHFINGWLLIISFGNVVYTCRTLTLSTSWLDFIKLQAKSSCNHSSFPNYSKRETCNLHQGRITKLDGTAPSYMENIWFYLFDT